jgi:putative transposase
VIAADSLCKGFRFPEEIISHAVWLCYRFLLSLRDVQELLLERGIVVAHETIRAWGERFGPDDARRLRSRRPRPGDRWHLDEVFVKMNGEQHYLWRAVDQRGNVLDVLVQSRRNAKAAERFFRKRLTGLQRVPRVIVTDMLASYEVLIVRRCPRSSTAARSTSASLPGRDILVQSKEVLRIVLLLQGLQAIVLRRPVGLPDSLLALVH